MVISILEDAAIAHSKGAYSTRVAGVYATEPGVKLRRRSIAHKSEETIPLALVGVVPTRVTSENGPIRRGDLLVTSSTPGHAMRANIDRLGFGMVLGKAMGAFDEPGSGRIDVMLTIR